MGTATGRSDARAVRRTARAQRRMAAQLLRRTDAGRLRDSRSSNEAQVGRAGGSAQRAKAVNMEKRKLGNTGFDVAPLALGGNVFGWTADEAMSFRLLDAFVAAGFNLVDTADSYSRWVAGHKGGESETTIGRWIARRGRHDDVIIATKVGSDMGQGHKLL